jgi:hypothetical protein
METATGSLPPHAEIASAARIGATRAIAGRKNTFLIIIAPVLSRPDQLNWLQVPFCNPLTTLNVTLLTSDQAATELAQSARDSAALDKVGFFRRESSVRGGYFITPDQIDQQKAVRLSDIVRQVPVIVETVGRTGPVLRGVRGCLITYVDGFPWRSMFPGDLDSYVTARDVVAVG